VFHFLLLTMFCHINHMLRNLLTTQSIRRVEPCPCPDKLAQNSAWPQASSGPLNFPLLAGMLCARQAPRVRDRSWATPKPRAPTALGRACDRRYGRHLGRGSPPQRPSSRFHDLAPREANWLVAAPQSDSDSSDVLPQAIRSPGRSAEQTKVKKDRTWPTSAGASSPGPAGLEPIDPIAMRVRPCNFPRPG
jgi:hypothetical protein